MLFLHIIMTLFTVMLNTETEDTGAAKTVRECSYQTSLTLEFIFRALIRHSTPSLLIKFLFSLRESEREHVNPRNMLNMQIGILSVSLTTIPPGFCSG